MDKKLKERVVSTYVTSCFDKIPISTDLGILFEYFTKQYPNYINWRLVVEYGYETSDIMLIADRWETNKELQKRIEKSKRAKESAKKHKQKKETAERKEYERLKKKYEKD